MICVPITATTTEVALEEIKEAEKVADVLELRVDYLSNPDLAKIVKTRIKPVIITNRKRDEGGKFSGSEAERLNILEEAVALGVEYIDIEWSCGQNVLSRFKDLVRETHTRIICSWHNFHHTPEDLRALYTSIQSSGVDVVKIVTQAKSINDNLKIFDLIFQAQKEGQDIIALCMGAYGEISRVLTPLLGAYLTFGSLQKGKESAPGQIEARVLRHVYRIPELKGWGDFRLFGLVGNPVSKSQGFRIHNRAFQHLKINHLYVNFLVEEVGSFVENFKEYIGGLSITMPHKHEIMKHIDHIDPQAQRIGAVNTVVKKNGHLTGYNTDCIGAISAIEEVTPITGKKVTLLGAGGVSRAIAWGIIERGGKLTILNRTLSKARQLAAELGCRSGGIDELKNLDCQIFINGTSLGMAPNIEETPVSSDFLRPDLVVFDTVYNPAQTRLLKEARAQGCRTISGLEMFVRQAAAQFKLWTGLEAPIEVMRSCLL